MNDKTERMTVAQFKASKLKPAKYGNRKNVVDGIPFASKLEAERYLELKQLQAIGVVKWFTMQVPFRLPGGIIYRADFLVAWEVTAETYCAVDPVTIEDTKGFMTRVSKNKIIQVQEIYGFQVKIVEKKGAKR